MNGSFATLTECIPGYIHSHIIQDRTVAIRHAVCQRCHKTLYFKMDFPTDEVGWIEFEFCIREWP